MNSRLDEPLSCEGSWGELIYLLNSRAAVYIKWEINSRVAKIMAT